MKNNKSLFWSVKGQKNNQLILFGTFHLAHPSLQPIADRALSLLDQCDDFVGETEIDKLDHSQLLNEPQGDLLSYLSKKQVLRLNPKFKKFSGLDLELVRHMHPMFITSMLCQRMLQSKGHGMDMELFQRAQKNGFETSGLESPDRQLEIFKSLNIDDQYKQFKKLLKNLQAYRSGMTEMIDLYCEQNIHALYKKARRELGTMRHLMINERNELMTNSVEAHYLLGRNSFVCCGAAHLSGKFGLIKQLRDRNYIVRPLPDVSD